MQSRLVSQHGVAKQYSRKPESDGGLNPRINGMMDASADSCAVSKEARPTVRRICKAYQQREFCLLNSASSKLRVFSWRP